jgi:hypothetical protein
MPRTPDVTVAAVTETAGRFLVVEERINHRLVLNQPAGQLRSPLVLRCVHDYLAGQRRAPPAPRR